MDDDPKMGKIRTVMFPWLAHGHVFPFLQLSKKLSDTNKFHIYFCSTPIILDSVRQALSGDANVWIELVELRLAVSDDELPPHHHTTKNLPPHLKPTLMKAFQMSSPGFDVILGSFTPDLLIYDGFQPWSAKQAASRGIPAVLFATSGAAAFSYYHHLHTHGTFDTFPYPEIYLVEHQKRRILAEAESIKVDDGEEGFAFGVMKLSTEIVLLKSCREIEGKYIDYLSSLCQKSIVSVGPLVVVAPPHQPDSEMIIRWLDEKGPKSTLYISFGSENYLSKEQIVELAKGLELIIISNDDDVNFIWVVRLEEEEMLPEGFMGRMKHRGLVLEGWAPQCAILAHPSVGGFMSHCGWGSIMESVYFGVPVLALPLNLDQPLNSRLVVEIGVGVEVSREGVAKAINEVMNGDGNGMMRDRVRELSIKLRMEEENLFSQLLHHLSMLCTNNK